MRSLIGQRGVGRANAAQPTTRWWNVDSIGLPSVITFSRASAARYMGSAGTILSAGNDTPRRHYDPITHAAKGVMIEPQATNLALWSNDITNAVWGKNHTNATVTATLAPDGSSAVLITEDTAAGAYHNLLQTVAKAASPITYTFTCYVKAGPTPSAALSIQITSSSSGVVQKITPATGALVGGPGVFGTFTAPSSYITPVGNGWYRVAVTATSDSDTVVKPNIVLFATDATTTIYTGDGAHGFYLWGAQLEATNYATSLIQTTTAMATRLLDNAYLSASRVPWINNVLGYTCMLDVTLYEKVSDGSTLLSAGKGVDGNDDWWLWMQTGGGAGKMVLSSRVGGVGGSTANYAYAANSRQKVAVVTTPTGMTLVANGAVIGSAAISGMAPVTLIALMRLSYATAAVTKGDVHNFRIWGRPLSNSEAQQVTT